MFESEILATITHNMHDTLKIIILILVCAFGLQYILDRTLKPFQVSLEYLYILDSGGYEDFSPSDPSCYLRTVVTRESLLLELAKTKFSTPGNLQLRLIRYSYNYVINWRQKSAVRITMNIPGRYSLFYLFSQMKPRECWSRDYSHNT